MPVEWLHTLLTGVSILVWVLVCWILSRGQPTRRRPTVLDLRPWATT